LVIQYRKDHPDATLQQIGDAMTPHISRERVRQLLKRDHARTSHVHNYKNKCKLCGKRLFAKTKSMICLDCHRATATCNYCGKTIHRGYALLTRHLKDQSKRKVKSQGNYYCDRKCFGAKMGKSVGFKSHPENISALSRYFTKEQQRDMQTMWLNGATIMQIARKYSICSSTVYKHLKSTSIADFS
jgi:predicted DNA-binding protein YlxM (UPF0122 family)